MTAEDLEKRLKTNVFEGWFSDKADIENSFSIPKGSLDNVEIIYAEYDCPPYEGYAQVYFYSREDNLFYSVHGSHCSCYGLEDQWEPEEIGGFDFFIEYISKVAPVVLSK